MTWLVLLAFFLALATAFQGGRDAKIAGELALAMFNGLVILIVVVAMRIRRQWRRFAAENARGAAALARGDLKVARGIFGTWASTTRIARASAIARHNLGQTLMRQGELQKAVDILIDNHAGNYKSLAAVLLLPVSSVTIALNYALLGNTEAAERWMTEAERRANVATPPSLPALKIFVRAVLTCRAGQPADAARLLAERWPECEATLTGMTLRPLRVVRAFAIAGAGPRDAGIAAMALPESRAAYVGEYDFLGVAWPEMAAFLASHELT